jgi:transposase-like protein
MLYERNATIRKLLKKLQDEADGDDQKILELFDDRFPDEQSCLDYLMDLRWGKSRKKLRCPHCGSPECRENQTAASPFRCRTCNRYISPKVGTLFQDSKLTLRQWFTAMWFMTYRKSGMSASELQRLLNLKNYRIALAFSHKLRYAMAGDNIKPLLGKVVEVEKLQIEIERSPVWILIVCQRDYGVQLPRKTRERRNVNSGAGDSRHFPPFLRIVQLDGEDYPVMPVVTRWVQPRVTVWTNERLCDENWERVFLHRISGRDSDNGTDPLKMVHKAGIDLLQWFKETYHSHVSLRYLQHYLDEFVFWYNRRLIYSEWKNEFKPTYRWIVFDQLLKNAVQTKPIMQKEIKDKVIKDSSLQLVLLDG